MKISELSYSSELALFSLTMNECFQMEEFLFFFFNTMQFSVCWLLKYFSVIGENVNNGAWVAGW